MKLTDYFLLTLEDRVELEEDKRKHKVASQKKLDNYHYNINDCCCRLTMVRAWQLTDILGKYKIF